MLEELVLHGYHMNCLAKLTGALIVDILYYLA